MPASGVLFPALIRVNRRLMMGPSEARRLPYPITPRYSSNPELASRYILTKLINCTYHRKNCDSFAKTSASVSPASAPISAALR